MPHKFDTWLGVPMTALSDQGNSFLTKVEKNSLTINFSEAEREGLWCCIISVLFKHQDPSLSGLSSLVNSYGLDSFRQVARDRAEEGYRKLLELLGTATAVTPTPPPESPNRTLN